MSVQADPRELQFIHRFRKAFRTATVGEASALSLEEARDVETALRQTRERMGKFYIDKQILGRRETIGCVALEITQRCNLDCTLCYLSENSESVEDMPIQELFRRLDEIKRLYGPGVSVQITGGDPTLRKREELVAIVRRARELGLQPALFTNGIKATRDLLEELVGAGLMDVAFHVDMTQERKGYTSERELNAIRSEYIERARGLPLTVIFNQTVFQGNFEEVPDLIRFYRRNSDVVKMVSFQLQADTGRGELRKRAHVISIETVREQIRAGAETNLGGETILIGHPKCHNFFPMLCVNGNLYDVLDDEKTISRALDEFRHLFYDRRLPIWKNALLYLWGMRRKPGWYLEVLKYTLPRMWRMKWDLLRAKGRVNRLSFFIHNFMDADGLEQERVDACSFMVMSPDGPVSMCAHNARRDDYILRPIQITTDEGVMLFNPLKKRRGKAYQEQSDAPVDVAGQCAPVPSGTVGSGGCGGCGCH
jgi:7,8-dihydro-6-hydroxymethylpterin dimethyltransferase